MTNHTLTINLSESRGNCTRLWETGLSGQWKTTVGCLTRKSEGCWICVLTELDAYAHVSTHTNTHTHIYTHPHTHIHTETHTNTHTCSLSLSRTHTHTHTHTLITQWDAHGKSSFICSSLLTLMDPLSFHLLSSACLTLFIRFTIMTVCGTNTNALRYIISLSHLGHMDKPHP